MRLSYDKSSPKTPQGELHHYSTVRHLLDIASGSAPAFQPTHRSRIDAGPFTQLQGSLCGLLALAKKDDYFPLILGPAHLEHEGEVGYYSLRCPSVPGPKPPEASNYADIPGSISDAIDEFREEPSVNLDFERTTFFARTGDFSMDAKPAEGKSSRLPVEELVPAPQGKVFLNSTFFVSGARVVRRNGKAARGASA